MTPIDKPDDSIVPKGARSLWKAAERCGWTVCATSAAGTPIDAQGRPQHVTKRVPTGEVTPNGKQRVEVVVTDELLVVQSVVVRLRRAGVRLVAIYEDGSFRTALRQGSHISLGARDVAAAISMEETA